MKRMSMALVVLLAAASAVAATEAPPTEAPETEAAAGSVSGATGALAETEPSEAPDDQSAVEDQEGPKNAGPKMVSGMSVLGNQEAPKSLVIVPWKSSELGASPGITTMLDDSKQPVDRAVFMRALNYYEIRSGTTP